MRVGIDLVTLAEVHDALRSHGDRYLTRVYTETELAQPAGATGPELAARFAAKEAVRKVLAPGEEALGWREVEVLRRRPSSWEVRLHGRAADLALAAGLDGVQVDVARHADSALAVAIA